MGEIFISYAREDRPFASQLAEALEAEGWSVWWDRDIPAGKSFDDVIEQAIDAAKCLIVIWSQHSVKSRWVRTEAGEGASRNALVPVMIEEVKIPLAFRRIHAANLSDWQGDRSEDEFRRLVNDVAGVVGKPATAKAPAAKKPTAASEPEAPSEKPQPKPARRGWLPLAAAVLAAVVALGVWQPWIRQKRDIPTAKEAVASKEPQEQDSPKRPDAAPDNSSKALRLRNRPASNLSAANVKSLLQKRGYYCASLPSTRLFANPSGTGIKNDFIFETRGEKPLAYDRATGLVWQAWVARMMHYSDVKTYIAKANQAKLAGYSNWRLPTLDELMSLMQPQKARSGLYTHTRFSGLERYLFTSDMESSKGVWLVNFEEGSCSVFNLGARLSARPKTHVRLVRTARSR